MSHLTPITTEFLFDTADVRTAIDDLQNPWFCAKDVCAVLGIIWDGHTLDNIPEEWFMMVPYTTIKGERDINFINEPGLYKMVFRSNKPKAEEFANWVCSEVLPKIRKFGSYGMTSHKERLAYSKQIVDISTRMTVTKDAMLFKQLTDELRELCSLTGKPMPDFSLLGRDYKQLDMFLNVSGAA